MGGRLSTDRLRLNQPLNLLRGKRSPKNGAAGSRSVPTNHHQQQFKPVICLPSISSIGCDSAPEMQHHAAAGDEQQITMNGSTPRRMYSMPVSPISPPVSPISFNISEVDEDRDRSSPSSNEDAGGTTNAGTATARTGTPCSARSLRRQSSNRSSRTSTGSEATWVNSHISIYANRLTVPGEDDPDADLHRRNSAPVMPVSKKNSCEDQQDETEDSGGTKKRTSSNSNDQPSPSASHRTKSLGLPMDKLKHPESGCSTPSDKRRRTATFRRPSMQGLRIALGSRDNTLNNDRKRLVQESWSRVLTAYNDDVSEFGLAVFRRVFEVAPELRSSFSIDKEADIKEFTSNPDAHPNQQRVARVFGMVFNLSTRHIYSLEQEMSPILIMYGKRHAERARQARKSRKQSKLDAKTALQTAATLGENANPAEDRKVSDVDAASSTPSTGCPIGFSAQYFYVFNQAIESVISTALLVDTNVELERETTNYEETMKGWRLLLGFITNKMQEGVMLYKESRAGKKILNTKRRKTIFK